MTAVSWIRLLLLVIVAQLSACAKGQPDPETPGKSVRLQQEAMSESYGIEASQRLLTTAELLKLSPYQLKIMKNGIYARHGYTFKTRDMVDYFEKQEWYERDPDYNDRRLTAIERDNIKLITAIEAEPTAAGTASDRKSLISTWGGQLAQSNDGVLASTEYELFDIDGDRDKDAVAYFLYGGAGSSHLSCHLAVFENRDGIYVHLADCPAGERGESLLTKIVNASNGTITCTTTVWLEQDGLCCPSGTGAVVYRLSGTDLEQIR